MMAAFRELSDETMATALDAASRGDLVATMKAVYAEFGIDLADPSSPAFRAMDYEIPMKQWTAICGALQAGSNLVNRDLDAMARVNFMLDWVNLGPSAHDPEDDR